MRSFHREDCSLTTPDASSRNARGECMHFSSRRNQSRVEINNEAAATNRAVVDDGYGNDCYEQTALSGIDPTFLQISECVDSAVAEEGPVRSSSVD